MNPIEFLNSLVAVDGASSTICAVPYYTLKNVPIYLHLSYPMIQ